jgi:alpha-1,6-mannosyltransferase
VWGCARRLGRPPAAAVAFAGLNPIVLMWGLGGKHTEFLMMALVMTGALLALGRREVLGGATLAAAVAIKATAGLLAPVIALGMPRRTRTLVGLAGGGIALAALSYRFFGPHLPNLRDQGRLVSVYSLPQLLGYAAGRGGADATVRRIAEVVMVAGAGVCAAYAWRTRRWATAAGWAALIAALTTNWLVPWYVIWALPLAALSPSRTLRVATVLVTVWFVLVWSWVAGPWLKSHGYLARSTPVGRANAAFEHSLLKDPRAATMRKRRRSLRRAPILARRHAPPHRLPHGAAHPRVRHVARAARRRTGAHHR